MLVLCSYPFRSFLIALAMLPAVAALAQDGPLAPTHRDVAYGSDHGSQKLDVYLAKADQPTAVMVFIHGGGWRGGSKARLPSWVEQGVRQNLYSAVAVEYRFTDVATHPAQVNDCLRAIQYTRAHARDWNIDTKRIGVTGGSAGGHLSLYVALHDDVAKADATDPVAKQSSRVAMAISFAGPTDWSLLKQIDHKHPAYRQLIGYEPGKAADAMDADKMRDVSPISFVSADDPPIMQVHGDKDDIVPIEHAKALQQRLEQEKVRAELVVIPGGNHGVAGAAPAVSERAVAFTKELLLK